MRWGEWGEGGGVGECEGDEGVVGHIVEVWGRWGEWGEEGGVGECGGDGGVVGYIVEVRGGWVCDVDVLVVWAGGWWVGSG